MNRCSFCEWISILPWPIWPLAGQLLLGQNVVVGSMTLLLAVRGKHCHEKYVGTPVFFTTALHHGLVWSYRQVEIAIKRWKSVLDVDALRAKATSPLAEVWLHGKLLYALMLERRMRRQLGDSWGRLDHERVGTWWRVWGMLKDELAPMITGALFWKEGAW